MTTASISVERSERINIRVAPGQRALIDQAAKAIGKTRTDFILDVATREAEHTLLDQRLFLLDDAQWQRMMDQLDAVPQPTEALRQLLTTETPWS